MRKFVIFYATILFMFGIFVPEGVNADDNLTSGIPASEMKATVNLSSGTLNMRKSESSSAPLVTKIPNHATVIVEIKGEEWCKVRYEGKTGYVMTKFLVIETAVQQSANSTPMPPTDELSSDNNTSTEDTASITDMDTNKDQGIPPTDKRNSFIDAASFPTSEQDPLLSGDYEYLVNADGNAMITNYRGNEAHVIVPSLIDGYVVIGIGEEAFYSHDFIVKIQLPETLLFIGDSAFTFCEKLLLVNLPNSLVKIGANPFRSSPTIITMAPNHPCFVLIDDVLIDKFERKIISYPFGIDARSYEVPADIQVIGDYAFASIDLLSIALPKGLQRIGINAFESSDLESIILPKGLQSIGSGAFWNSDLESIILPKGLLSIGEFAFKGCWRLTSITLPDSLMELGPRPFEVGAKITLSPKHPRFTIINDALIDKTQGMLISYYDSHGYVNGYDVPKGILKIGDYAFYDSPVSSVTLPEGLESIGDYAFATNSYLENVTIPESLKHIGNSAFFGCPNLSGSFKLPEGLLSLGDYAFRRCDKLYNSGRLYISASVTKIGKNPFADILITVVLSPDNARYAQVDGVLFDKVEKMLVYYPAFPQEKHSYSIPQGIKSIGDCAFYNHDFLTSLALPEGLVSIGESAIFGCDGITSLTLPEGLEKIGAHALFSLKSRSLTVPDSVMYIGQSAFGNTRLTVTKGSYAAEWAKRNNNAYEYSDDLDWLGD